MLLNPTPSVGFSLYKKRPAAIMQQAVSVRQKSLAEFAPRTAQIRSKLFSPAACTSGKILLALQVWNFCAEGAEIMRAAGCNPLQMRAQRSGSHLRACQKYFFDTLKTPLQLVLQRSFFCRSRQFLLVHPIGHDKAVGQQFA